MYSGWKLTDNSITQLKNIFKPVHPDFIGHHITYMFGNDSIIPAEAELYVIGRCVTDSIECFVTTVNGKLVRPDSKFYHITWSIDKGKGATPAKSNNAIEDNGFEELPNPIKVYGSPQIFKY